MGTAGLCGARCGGTRRGTAGLGGYGHGRAGRGLHDVQGMTGQSRSTLEIVEKSLTYMRELKEARTKFINRISSYKWCKLNN
ncbi:hypothetical protein MAR_020546 [Mya arenaria]|uniref:Uncharacterized protein n=1 Tax=Mya arenaria TaxID=6604 RepID=A0ABY7E895_MYAAR|nr:hypothetical protein MAR_020546 [Mya arenaria]